MSQLNKWAQKAIGSRNLRKLQEHGLTVVPLQLMNQLKTVKEQQTVIIEGVALTVRPLQPEDLETSTAGYICFD
ncbi:hypothetical protein [Paenibacillus sp. GXUN7292]|uniref:hypothetical protein n=1 Tax=Paenibacillus sp. GXUN7292 TaxID=3422499 RepID=UPI003D7DC38C